MRESYIKPATPQPTRHFYEFGRFRVDATEKVLLRDGVPISITPKAFETLLTLVESTGRILEKDDLLKKVWPDTVVEENNLAQNVSTLRKVLGQGPEGSACIETTQARLPIRGHSQRELGGGSRPHYPGASEVDRHH